MIVIYVRNQTNFFDLTQVHQVVPNRLDLSPQAQLQVRQNQIIFLRQIFMRQWNFKQAYQCQSETILILVVHSSVVILLFDFDFLDGSIVLSFIQLIKCNIFKPKKYCFLHLSIVNLFSQHQQVIEIFQEIIFLI